MKKFLTIAALAASAAAFAITSAGAAGYMKFDGIKGETAKGRQHKPMAVTKAVDKAQHRARGVRVATGDVNGDGVPATEKGRARVRGGLNPATDVQAPQAEQRAEKGHARVRGGLDPATDVKSPDSEPQPVGLLLPAVQKAH